MDEKKTPSVFAVTAGMVQKLENQQKEGNGAAALLAALRNSVGKPFSEAEDIWPFFFENLPAAFLSTNGSVTAQEKAIYGAMQIYALCRQGASHTVIVDNDLRLSMGGSLKSGRDVEDPKALDRRFNALLTASSFEEFTYHLRQLTKLVKAKATLTVNIAGLANDLFWYQRGRKQNIIMNWAKDYYRYNSSDNQNTQEDHENE